MKRVKKLVHVMEKRETSHAYTQTHRLMHRELYTKPATCMDKGIGIDTHTHIGHTHTRAYDDTHIQC